VLSVNRRQPLRPRVIVQGGPRDPGDARIVDLAESPFVFITQTSGC
jgi:hypothetical protein